MKLDPFIAKTVQPGEPLTAQAWNDIVQGIAALYAYLEATEGTQLQATIANTELDLQSARVTAVGVDGRVAEAVRPIPPDTRFTFIDLEPGAYTVRAEAPGYDPSTQSVTAPSVTAIDFSLTRNASAMPEVFGLPLEEALAELELAEIAVSRILDVVGRDVAPAQPDQEYRTSPVLMQLPEPGQPVSPGQRAQLVVAAALESEPAVEVPSLSGLTLQEARKALESLGLTLGKVQIKTRTETPES